MFWVPLYSIDSMLLTLKVYDVLLAIILAFPIPPFQSIIASFQQKN
jgi:hypothetical protein